MHGWVDQTRCSSCRGRRIPCACLVMFMSVVTREFIPGVSLHGRKKVENKRRLTIYRLVLNQIRVSLTRLNRVKGKGRNKVANITE